MIDYLSHVVDIMSQINHHQVEGSNQQLLDYLTDPVLYWAKRAGLTKGPDWTKKLKVYGMPC